MDNKAQIEKVVIINNVNEALTVSSLQIAEHFNKRHDHVLRDIKKVITDITSTQNWGDVTSPQNSANLFYMAKYQGGNLCVGKVIQKVAINLDENGTKAAAATVAEVYTETAPKYIKMDRPFIYAIVDDATGLPLFIGTVVNLAG